MGWDGGCRCGLGRRRGGVAPVAPGGGTRGDNGGGGMYTCEGVGGVAVLLVGDYPGSWSVVPAPTARHRTTRNLANELIWTHQGTGPKPSIYYLDQAATITYVFRSCLTVVNTSRSDLFLGAVLFFSLRAHSHLFPSWASCLIDLTTILRFVRATPPPRGWSGARQREGPAAGRGSGAV